MKESRRKQITQAYLSGMTCRQLGEVFNRSPGAIQTDLSAWGVKLSPEERRRRRMGAGQRAVANGWGWKQVWPDCPDHLKADYENMSRYMSKREARRMLEQ